jgi:hypothetical protein
MCDDSISALNTKFIEILKQEKRKFLEGFFNTGKRIIDDSIRANPGSPPSWEFFMRNYLIRSALKQYGFDTLLYEERKVSVLKDLKDLDFIKANFSVSSINEHMHGAYKKLFEKQGGEDLMSTLKAVYDEEISLLKKATAATPAKTTELPSTYKPPQVEPGEPPQGLAHH